MADLCWFIRKNETIKDNPFWTEIGKFAYTIKLNALYFNFGKLSSIISIDFEPKSNILWPDAYEFSVFMDGDWPNLLL